MTGFVFLNKEQGMTSFSAAARLRRIFCEKKTGHTGTLDPMATGVLPVALGGATRFIELLESHDKAYRASFLLGKTTDTLDITGTLLSQSEVSVKKEDVESVLCLFRGKIRQLPPMYSAIKKDGVRLYELARQGIEVEREERDVTVYALTLLGADEEKGEYEIEVSCSCGTYIRSLISDIGEKLGCGAVMTRLERTAANGVLLSECKTLVQLEEMKENGTLSSALIPVDKMLPYQAITVSAAQAKRFSNGGELAVERVRQAETDGFYNMYSPDGRYLGIGERVEKEGIIKVKRVYVER